MSKEGIPFYRCILCGNVVSLWDIHNPPHSCTKCGQVKISPTNLTWWEKIKQIYKHPKIWTWNEQLFT